MKQLALGSNSTRFTPCLRFNNNVYKAFNNIGLLSVGAWLEICTCKKRATVWIKWAPKVGPL